MDKAIAMPSHTELMQARSLLPVLGMLDGVAKLAGEDADRVQAVLEGYAMVEAVAKERRLREQADRAEGGVVRMRAKLGALTPDGRKGRSGKTLPPDKVLTPSDHQTRHVNRKLAQVGETKVAETVETLLGEGERPTPAKVLKRAKGGPVPASGEQEWYTPPELVEAARRVMGGIDLDPASSEGAQATVQADRFHTREDDGLAQPWEGRVWLNPPYSAGLVDRFADRLVGHLRSGAVTQAVWLSNASYDTRWGQALCREATGLCMVAGRVRFVPGSGQPAGAGAWASMILYFGIYSGRFAKEFGEHGVVWHKGGVR